MIVFNSNLLKGGLRNLHRKIRLLLLPDRRRWWVLSFTENNNEWENVVAIKEDKRDLETWKKIFYNRFDGRGKKSFGESDWMIINF